MLDSYFVYYDRSNSPPNSMKGLVECSTYAEAIGVVERTVADDPQAQTQIIRGTQNLAQAMPQFLLMVWLDGQPVIGNEGGSVCSFQAAVPTRTELETLLRMVGNFFGAERGRAVRVSVRDLAGDWWCKPSGIMLGDKFAAYALETWTNCGDVRV